MTATMEPGTKATVREFSVGFFSVEGNRMIGVKKKRIFHKKGTCSTFIATGVDGSGNTIYTPVWENTPDLGIESKVKFVCFVGDHE